MNTSSIHQDDNDNTTAAVGGVFFIENIFYTCGSDGMKVQEAIDNWLDARDKGGAETKNVAEVKAVPSLRREYLGLSSLKTKYATTPMVEMRLEDLPIRLGVRYFHMFIPPPVPLFQHLLDDPASSPSWCRRIVDMLEVFYLSWSQQQKWSISRIHFRTKKFTKIASFFGVLGNPLHFFFGQTNLVK